MKLAIPNPFTITSRQKIAAEVAEELQFHIDMLEGKFTQSGMPATQAKTAAFARFGTLERIKRQCVDIRRRNTLLQRGLKILTILLGLTGVLIRILAADYKVTRIGTVLIMIAIFGRLLLYARGLVTSTLPARTNETVLSLFPEDS